MTHSGNASKIAPEVKIFKRRNIIERNLPTKNFPVISDQEIENCVKISLEVNPNAFALDEICKQPLGFYLFTTFLKTSGSEDIGNFLIESALLQMNRSSDTSTSVKQLVARYLLDEPSNLPPSIYIPGLYRRNHIYEDSERNSPVKISRRRDNSLILSGGTAHDVLEKFGNSSPIQHGHFDEEKMSELISLDNEVFGLLKEKHYETFRLSSEYKLFLRFKAMLEGSFQTEKDFTISKIIGHGGFAVVHSCTHCITGKDYAIKIIDKKRVKYRRAEALILAERGAMEDIVSPFIIGMRYAFSSPFHLYIVMDLMIGGDLATFLKQSLCTIEQAKYYAARTLIGLSVLHLHNYVYRDLKPDNILLDLEGVSKLSDLGLSVHIDGRGCCGLCGTRGYWAPEMLKPKGDGGSSVYSYEVDWFSLGCCIYEFLVGKSPFRTEEAKNFGPGDVTTRVGLEKNMDLAVLELEPDLSVIKDEKCRDLIFKLLKKDPRKRLGARGYDEITSHEWFEGINWEALHCAESPFKPSITVSELLANEMESFDDENEVNRINLSPEDQILYCNWDYTSQRGSQEEIVEYLLNNNGQIQSVVETQGTEKYCCSLS